MKKRNTSSLLDHLTLEGSPIVANNSMNRERELCGTNGYEIELGFEPYAFLCERLQVEPHVRWLDLCCGTDRALIEAALHSEVPNGGIGL